MAVWWVGLVMDINYMQIVIDIVGMVNAIKS